MSRAKLASDAPIKPTKRYRLARVAVSMFFGVLTVALMVWWNGASAINESLRPFGLGSRPSALHVYLYLAAISLVVAGTPWLPKLPLRFSTQTLLIATTLIAVLLGLGVWLAR